MNRGVFYFLIAVAIVGVIGGAALLASLYYQSSGEASAPIQAQALSLEGEGNTVASGDRRLFRISQAESQVRFELDEQLMGAPKHVVGTTNQVAGDIIIDFSNPANSEIGMIRVNARTLATDNDFRNRALRLTILQSSQDAYEFIEFTPTTLEGLPTSGEVGQSYEFAITGDLKIRDIVRPVTFQARVTLTEDGRLEGTAETTVMRSDFELQIPEVPNVANVTEEVLLGIDFVALEITAEN